MDAGYFWVGEIPGRVINMRVLNDLGNNYDLTPYTTVEVQMLDTNNNRIDLSGSITNVINATDGLIGFTFPKDRSVFTEPGEYLIRIRMNAAGAEDYSEANGIIVREFGGVRW